MSSSLILDSRPPIFATQRPSTRITFVGRLTRIASNELIVADGNGEQSIDVDSSTELSRGDGHIWKTDHDLTRLKPGDDVYVVQAANANNDFVAEDVTANSFIGRDGIVAAVGKDSLSLRLRTDRLSKDFAPDSTIFYIDPSTRIVRLGPGGSQANLVLSDLQPGQLVALQGYIADDGAMVALYVWPSQ